ncbi:MAG TPA: DNA repair protein RecN [Rhodanobacteraceae bacterium]|nr:DNA repair protein RecN [Rhodanobacteraceae bacterium]
MLTRVHIRDFAIVDEVEVEFGRGMTVLTGETGAGKSLLVDALTLLAGARADAAMVRAGATRAELGAEFDLADVPAASAWLREQALDDGEACVLRRVVASEGGSRAWINGRPASASQLGELAALLVEIHGQHEHQALTRRSHQLALLDARGEHAPMLDALAQSVRRCRELETRIAELGGGEERSARLDWLCRETALLGGCALDAESLDALENDHRRLGHADQLLQGVSAAIAQLDGDDEVSARRLLAGAREALARLLELDASLAAPLELIDNAQIQIDEAADSLNRYARDQELDPQRLAQVDAQLGQLHDLARRHRVSLRELEATRDALRAEQAELEGAGETLTALGRELELARSGWAATAAKLSASRSKAAASLSADVTALMQELGMAGGRFEAALEPTGRDEPDLLGLERCEFMVTANPGQPPRPLRKVASGGELSRIGLAIEVAALGLDEVGTMVFDEVDSGIGGAVAEVVGQKLRALAASRQVLCVTHLPQVAAQGHAHLQVSKHSAAGATGTRLVGLGGEQRDEEIARMLGGIEITAETMAHARQMLARAQAAGPATPRRGSARRKATT